MNRAVWLSSAPVAAVAWMFAVTYFERETLVATGLAAAYVLPLVIFAPAALHKPWVQIISAVPILIVVGAAGACAFWALLMIV